MAMDKAFREIIERLDRIEAKLDGQAAKPDVATRLKSGQLVEARGEQPKQPKQPAPPQEKEPWADYDEQPIDEIAKRLRGMNETERESVLAYERSNKNRQGLVSPSVNWNSRAGL